MYKIRHLSEEEKMKICYEVCEGIDFNNAKKVYSKVNLYADEVKEYAYKYVKLILKRNLTEKEFMFLAPKKIIGLLDNSIITYMIKENAITKENACDYHWVISNLDEAVSRFCYKLFSNNEWMAIKVRKICEANNLNYSLINSYCYKYNFDYLKVPADEYNKMRMEGQVKSIKQTNLENLRNLSFQDKLISNILDAKSDSEVIQIMIESKKVPYYVTGAILEYAVRYNLDYKKLSDKINKKLKCYKDYYTEKRDAELQETRDLRKRISSENNLLKAKEIINGYESSEILSIKKYCKSINVSIVEFKRLLNLANQYDKELYERFLIIEKQKREYEFAKNKNDFEKIKYYIKNGIVDSITNELRSFDLLDYYEVTDLSPVELCSSLPNLGSDDYTLIRLFNAKYPSNKLLSDCDIVNILNTKRVLNAEFDNKGSYIPGSGRIVEKEETEESLEYLKQNNIPITYETYDLAIKRLINGNLKEKEKVYKLDL